MTTRGRRPSGRASSAVAAAVVLVAAACSGATGGQVGADITAAPSTYYSDAASQSAASAKLEAPAVDATMRLQATVSVTAGERVAALSVDAAETGEPFGRFAACSGWQSAVTTYGVSVRDPGSGEVGAISVLTEHPISGPGIQPATIRLETSDGPIVATGTLDLDDSLRAGAFTGFDADGVPVSGRFACAGAEADPVPLDDADSGIELAVYLRSGESEEIVGLVARPGDAAVVTCADADGAVRVEGDASLGAVTAFELSDDPAPSLRLRVGGATYELDDVAVQLAADATAGTFAGAAAEGVTVDGAFRCR